MTTKELWDRVSKNDGKFLCELWCRWQDEKEFEDIQDYLKAIQKRIPEAEKITKRPFGVICNCNNGKIHIYAKRVGNYLDLFGKIVK